MSETSRPSESGRRDSAAPPSWWTELDREDLPAGGADSHVEVLLSLMRPAPRRHPLLRTILVIAIIATLVLGVLLASPQVLVAVLVVTAPLVIAAVLGLALWQRKRDR